MTTTTVIHSCLLLTQPPPLGIKRNSFADILAAAPAKLKRETQSAGAYAIRSMTGRKVCW
jgi:hypothetical protein